MLDVAASGASDEEAEEHRPGPIDNASLLDPAYDAGEPTANDTKWTVPLRADISDEDVHALPNRAYQFLKKQYGGGPDIPRLVEREGGQLVVQLATLRVRVATLPEGASSTDPLDTRILYVPLGLPITDFKEEVAKALRVSSSDYTLWDYHGNTKFKNMDVARREGDTVESMHIQDDQVIVLERSPATDDAGAMDFMPAAPVGPSSVRPYRMTPAIDYTADSATVSAGVPPGLAGLVNLGNTCFMNCSLQCLGHAVPLMRCFLTGAYRADVNEDNPLGKGGEVAHAFGALMEMLWRGGVSAVAPRGFKRVLGKHAPQFQGYEQHDSQELLSYLLDMLHEDINRIKQKPYIEEKDDPVAPDEAVAAEAWASYRARNDSGIVDHFQGLLKSTLDCPNCAHHKRKFDPFMYLSLPLPGSDCAVRQFVFVVVGGSTPPLQCAARVKKGCSVAAFRAAVAETMELKVDNPEAAMAVATFTYKLEVLDDDAAELPYVSPRDRLIVYFYNSPDAGPQGGGRKTLIWPPSRQFVPLLLFVKPGVRSEHLEPHDSVFLAVRRDCMLRDHVDDALRPFKRRKAQDGSQRMSSSDVFASAAATQPSPSCERPRAASWAGGDGANGAAFGPHRAEAACQGGQAPPDDRQASAPMDEDNCSAGVSPTQPAAAGLAIGMPALVDVHGSPVCHGLPAEGGFIATGVPAAAAHEDTVKAGEAWTLIRASGDDGAGGACESAGPVRPSGQVDAPAFADSTGASGQQLSGQPGGRDGLLGGETNAAAPDGSLGGMGGIPAAQPLDLWAGTSPAPAADAAGGRSDTLEAGAGPRGDDVPFRLVVADDQGHPIRNPSPNYAPAPDGADASDSFKLELDANEDVDSLFDMKAINNLEEHPSCHRYAQRVQHTLDACIQSYLASEILSPSDAWFCPKCKTDVQARKALALWRLPEVLVVHLKRFSYTGHGYLSTISHKLDSLVEFPLQGLDLTQHVHDTRGESAVYDCFAVSNHFGSASGGHYTAYCCQPLGGGPPGAPPLQQWHLFNDAHVSPATERDVVSSAAYVLFYRRRADSCRDSPKLLEEFREERQSRETEEAWEREQQAKAAPSGQLPSPQLSPAPTPDFMDEDTESSIPGLLGPRSASDSKLDALLPAVPQEPPLHSASVPSTDMDQASSFDTPCGPTEDWTVIDGVPVAVAEATTEEGFVLAGCGEDWDGQGGWGDSVSATAHSERGMLSDDDLQPPSECSDISTQGGGELPGVGSGWRRKAGAVESWLQSSQRRAADSLGAALPGRVKVAREPSQQGADARMEHDWVESARDGAGPPPGPS